jgi:class 3 adenylate cyclase
MISGNIGSRTLKRLDYTVIGDVVNTAQRLQSVADPGQILIRKESFEKIKEYFKCKAVGHRTLKNKEEPVEVYEVLE